MRNKMRRAAVVGALAIGGWGIGAMALPAHATNPANGSPDLCENEAAPGDVQVVSPVLGVDTGLTGAQGVVVVCVRQLNGTTIAGAGAGYNTVDGRFYVCGAYKCDPVT